MQPTNQNFTTIYCFLARTVFPCLLIATALLLPTPAKALDFDPETVEVEDLFPSEISVNPRDFGARGDGVTDDTNAILAAITSIEARGKGILLFDEGDYYCPSWPREGLVVSAPIAIQGTNATLRGDGNAILFDMAKQFMIEGMTLQNWRVGIRFHRVGAANNTQDADWVLIRRNSFSKVNHPILAYRSGSFRNTLSEASNPHRIKLVKISDNTSSDSRSGICIAAIHIEDIIIARNLIENISRIDYDLDPDDPFNIVSAIRIGLDGESLDNGQRTSNVVILNNVIREIHNYDPINDRIYGILHHRGPDRIEGNWLQNFRSSTGRVMGIYSRSAADAVTKNNVFIDVSSDDTDTVAPSRGAISSKKARHLNHLIEGNVIIFTEAYKNETDHVNYTGMLIGNQNAIYRDNLLIGCTGGGINTWRLSSNETSRDLDLIFEDNIIINSVGPAFSNYFGRQEIRVINNTLIRHSGALFLHGSLAVSDPVNNLKIADNRMFDHRSRGQIIATDGSGIKTGEIKFQNNFYQHIDVQQKESFGQLDGGGGLMGTWTSDWLNEDSIIRIEGNKLIGFRQNWNSDISPNYILRLYAKVKEVSISGNHLHFGHRIFNPEPGNLPDNLAINDNHIVDYTQTITFAGRGQPEDHEWNDIEFDYSNNTGNFDSMKIGNLEFAPVAAESRLGHLNTPNIDDVAKRVAERIHSLIDPEIRNKMIEELDWLIGSIPEPTTSDWSFSPLQTWAR